MLTKTDHTKQDKEIYGQQFFLFHCPVQCFNASSEEHSWSL